MNTATTQFPNTTAATAVGNTVGAAADRAHQVVDRAAEKAAPVIDRASDVAHRSIDKAARAAAPAADWVAESSKQLMTTSNELVDACSGYVRARPLTSLAAALVFGFFAGKLLR